MAFDGGKPDIGLCPKKLDNLVRLSKQSLAVYLTEFDVDPIQPFVEYGVINLVNCKMLEPCPAVRHRKMAGVSCGSHSDCLGLIQLKKLARGIMPTHII